MSAFVTRLNAKLNQYETELQLSQYPQLNLIHEKTHLQRIHIVLGVIGIAFLFVVSVFGLQFVSNLFAFIPIYASFKALRTADTKEDDEKWLTYWCVFGTFSLVESLFDYTLSWLPLYYISKIAFLVWCFHPNIEGAKIVFSRFLNPLFLNLQSRFHALSDEFAELKQNSRPQSAAAARKLQ